jgi:hypothetical protein
MFQEIEYWNIDVVKNVSLTTHLSFNYASAKLGYCS